MAKLKMDESAASERYSCKWYNPGSGKFYDATMIQGSCLLEFSCPESHPAIQDYKDWVFYIRKVEN